MEDFNDLFRSDLQPMPIWTAQALAKVDKWANGEQEGAKTGFVDLDEYISLVDGELLTIAGRPSMGKTVLGMQIAENVARNLDTGCVAVFSAEMTGWSLVHRMAGALAGVNVHKLRKGRGTPQEYKRFSDEIRRLNTLPIWIDDGSGPTTQVMYERLFKLQEIVPVRMVLFDFLELGGNRGGTEELRISQIATSLKDLAKNLKLPVVALSQINRGVENRSNKMPTLSDLRYSGQIEQVSDTVCLIMRPEYYLKRGQQCDIANAQDGEGIAYVSIAKNRNGPVANVRMAFSEERARFSDLALQKHDLNQP